MQLMGVLPAAAAVLVAACAIAASTGFRGRTTVVGIDLGTTYSVIGLLEDNKVRIVHGIDGNPLLPSVVSFLQGGGVAVGNAAIEHLALDPAHTIYGAKRFIGRDLSDAAVAVEAAEHHFGLVHRPGDLSEAWFRIDKEGHEAAVSPQEVGSHVIRALLQQVAADLGHEQVDKAVIAVPAKFSPRQRQATADAFRMAGLKVIRVLEEPTAAALAYDLHRQKGVDHILVYDFGGGTLDVSVLFVSDGAVEVMASEGDDYLGGSDFDQLLARRLQELLGNRMVEVDAPGATAPAPTVLAAAATAVRGKSDGGEGWAAAEARILEEDGAEEAGAGAAAETGRRRFAAAATAAGATAAAAAAECEFEVPLCMAHMLYPLAEQAKRALSTADVTSVTCMARAAPPQLRGTAGAASAAAVVALAAGTSGAASDTAPDAAGAAAAATARKSNAAGVAAAADCGRWEPVTVEVTRADFETVCAPLFARALAPVDRLLEQLALAPSDVDEVVCVGGTTRIPRVRELLRERLGVERLNTHIDPDVTVAWGAATVAH